MTTTVRIQIEHNDTCKKLAAERAAFEQQYPGFCKKCGGQGAWQSAYATYYNPPEYETCEECVAQGICPRCGERGLTEEGEGPCTRCGFSFDYVPADECICWEEQSIRDLQDDEPRSDEHVTEYSALAQAAAYDAAVMRGDICTNDHLCRCPRCQPGEPPDEEPTKTRADVEMLKLSWASDPIWDLEDTEGFEEYHDELLQFSQNTHAQWDREREERVARKAEELGCPGNLKLAEYIISLEQRLARLERRVDGE